MNDGERQMNAAIRRFLEDVAIPPEHFHQCWRHQVLCKSHFSGTCNCTPRAEAHSGRPGDCPACRAVRH